MASEKQQQLMFWKNIEAPETMTADNVRHLVWSVFLQEKGERAPGSEEWCQKALLVRR